MTRSDPVFTRSLIAAIATISVTGFSLSLSYPLFGLLLTRMGASPAEIGWIQAAPAVAFVLGGTVMPMLLRRFSLPLLLTLAASGLALNLLLFPALPEIWVWAVLRFIYGLLVVAMFFGSELWIISVAPEARRGFIMGVYGVCLSAGFLCGPILLEWIGIDGWRPFVIAAVAALAAIAPVLWAWRDAPTGLGEERQSPLDSLRLFRSDTTLMSAAMLFGVIEFGGFSLMPIWGLENGFSEIEGIRIVTMIAAGNLLLQLPIGALADTAPRRPLFLICAASCVIGVLVMGLVAAPTWALQLAALVMGGMAVGLYTISLVELGSRYKGAALARGTAALIVAYGLGALIGPPVMGAAMDAFPPHGLLWIIGGVCVLFMTLTIARGGRRA